MLLTSLILVLTFNLKKQKQKQNENKNIRFNPHIMSRVKQTDEFEGGPD